MKPTTFYTAALMAALTLPAFAGPETVSHDGKDMKDMKQVAPMDESDSGFYVAAYGGSQFDTDYGNNFQIISNGALGPNGTHSDIHSGWGATGGIKAGYNFNSFPLCNFMSLRVQPAVEAEALYIDPNSHASDLGVPGSTEHFSTNSGDFFVNGILRFKNSSIVTPYIGVGVGLQYITTHGEIDIPGTPAPPPPPPVITDVRRAIAGGGGSGDPRETGLDTSDLDFAGQALFGLDFGITKHVSLFTEYKFIDAIGTDGKAVGIPAGGGTYRFKPDQIQQNLITAGIKYSF